MRDKDKYADKTPLRTVFRIYWDSVTKIEIFAETAKFFTFRTIDGRGFHFKGFYREHKFETFPTWEAARDELISRAKMARAHYEEKIIEVDAKIVKLSGIKTERQLIKGVE